MTQFLPPNLLALFAARDPVPYKPPTAQLSWEKDREKNPYCGVSQYTSLFEDPKDTPPPTRGETKAEKKARRIKEKAILRAKEIEEEVKNYDPHNNKSATGDAFKTLFVSRVNYDTSESKLRREFDMYGPIRKISMVKDSNGKPRGYAFIEFEHERDMHTAYKNADGKKIDGRRVLVDVERGRTVKGWRPRRLGGGLGATRRGPNEENVKAEGQVPGRGDGERPREQPRSASRDRRERHSSREKRDRGDRDRKRDRDRERPGREDRSGRDDRSRRDRDESGKDKDKDKGRDRDRDRKHRRDRSREKDGSRRKRSRERDRKDRDRSDRDRERSGRSRSDRDKNRDESRKDYRPDEYPEDGGVKQEQKNGDMDQSNNYAQNYEGGGNEVKQEPTYENHRESYEGRGEPDGYRESEQMKEAEKQEYNENREMEY
uniref:U1 small nuclear ribonucleoprotein 70 kDa-like n=1 Tax=Styela clava TaxID=7725 RepID=UPI00193A9B42|nr:U1 small nuclear ribonucleoprotein 70 kDa-like [Styela clava]